LNTKIELFYNSITAYDYEIICLSETWLSNKVSSSELFPNNFNVFRCDRDLDATGLKTGGGTLIAVQNNYNAIELDTLTLRNAFPTIDIVCSKIHYNHKFMIIYTLYIPPSVNGHDFELFFDALESFHSNLGVCNVMFCGDFNVPTYCLSNDDDKKSQVINNFNSFFEIKNINNINNKNGRLLDLVLTDIKMSVSLDTSPLVKVDNHHPPLLIEFIFPSSDNASNFNYNNSTTRYNFKRTNFPLLYEKLYNTDWEPLGNSEDVDIMCDEFYKIIDNVFSSCVPTFSNNPTRNYPPWFSEEIINNLKAKETARKNFKKYKLQSYHKKFIELRALVKSQINVAYSDYVQVVENSLVDDPMKFWSYINIKKGKSRIPGVMKYNNRELDNPQSIVDAFSAFFSDVYIQSNINNFSAKNVCPITNTNIIINNVTEEDIINASKKLKDKMTCGIDNCPSFLIKDCIKIFAKPLCKIFNLILANETYPTIWKTTKICPVFKKGDQNVISNYRPISILCNFGKLFEIILYERIYNAVHKCISPHQHGFMSKRSTVTNLSCITQFIADTLDSNGQVDVIYTDIQKAFDQIDHNLLLQKLDAIGLSNPLLKLFQSYLTDRNLFVEYGGYKSHNYAATSGVPQGSNLGPLLFLIFINDLALSLKCNHLLFADDLKIYTSIKDVDDCRLLQTFLNQINDWCLKNRLSLNVSKCTVVSFTKKYNTIIYDYNIDNNNLERHNSFKDLGVIFDSKLSFSEHISHIVSSSSKMLGYCVRNWSSFSNIDTLKLIYFTFIRSKLEYATLIWSPQYRTSINYVESVQRKCLKYFYFRLYGIFPERGSDHNILLQLFNIESLSNRRNCVALSTLYGLVNSKIDSSSLLGHINLCVPRIAARQKQTFNFTTPRTNILSKSPIYTMINLYNTFCNSCDVFSDQEGFIIQTYSEAVRAG
jgi:Reverse transcriptase (RNA-dependent DNA polymerase)